MEWYIDTAEPSAARELRQQVRSYLERHADASSDLDGAEIIASELITNVVHHAEGSAWVELEWDREAPVLSVVDLGPGFHLDVSLPDDLTTPVGGRGLFIVDQLAEGLEATVRSSGGTRVSAVLPVRRRVGSGFDPIRYHTNVLPAMEEARPEGGFDKMSFLRALVVQLAQTVEERSGPEEAEATVAQVGTDVGGRMEEEYRVATSAEGRLSPEQIAECYVRLKHAIDGGFRAVEVDAERIVLTNDRCPFGDVVQRSPSLCRMTSSVFGGIAARNVDGGAVVTLVDRIAIGDHHCRVVVDLAPGPEPGEGGGGHHYPSPPPPAPV